MSVSADPALTVNGITVDFAAESLRDRAGNPVPLRPQSFAVLRHLAAARGRLVTRDEIMAAVWPGIAVTDDSLVQCIGDIRRALGDEARWVVRTVPRRGYRMVLPTEPERAPDRRASRRWLAPAAALLVAAGTFAAWHAARPDRDVPPLGGPPIVAVVPFVDLAGDAASQRLAGGFGKHFHTVDLARFRDFQLVLRGPTFVYRDLAADGLAVDYVLGGRIHRAGDRLGLTAELTDARTGAVVWSERWDRPDRDTIAMQAELAEQIANRLGGTTGLLQELGRTVAQERPPADRTAWERFLVGSGQFMLGTRAGAAEAAALLGEAVELEPGLGQAWAMLALAHVALAGFDIDAEANRRAALEAARQASFLDPANPWAHAALGAGFRLEGDLVRARTEFDTALTIAPSAAEIMALFAGWAPTAGEPERGAAMADHVARLDPDFPPWAAAQFTRAYFMAGRYRLTLAMIERLQEDARTPAIRVMHAGALAAVGRPAEAAASVAETRAAHPEISIASLVSAPGWGDAERRRLVETMRLAGFPPCDARAAADALAHPPECASLAVNH